MTAVAVRPRASSGPIDLKAYRLAEGWQIALGPWSLTRWQRASSRTTARTVTPEALPRLHR